LVVGVVGLLLDKGIARIEAGLLRWRGDTQQGAAGGRP
jgi:ABC-type nitrate/sulfonate/bicarbonate transport system permease component